ncbi:MAG TPA: hypothetical protein VGV35_21115 [Bryobacteraceae bacterium]|nr:hypothetical protein [Bryobacteraceae bacterium]
MTNKAGLYLFVLMACFFAGASCVKGQSWQFDRDLAADLTKNGTCVEQERATLCFESGILQPEEIATFADLVNRGIVDIEAYLGATRLAGRKIRYFISSKVDISHSTWRSIYLPMTKVQNRTVPYLHETTHVLAPCDSCPMWFSEGLASYIQSYVSEHTGGYDGGIFSRRGNRGIDQDARRWVASDRGQAVIPFIGIHGEPPSINYDRSNVAAPFYVMAQSFVKFLMERNTPEQDRAVIGAKDFDADLQANTGKSASEWKDLWLADLKK